MFFSLVSAHAGASSTVNIYLFWGEGCSHCAREKAFINEILPKYPEAKLNTYEIYYNPKNIELMQKVASELNVNASGVPFLIIGDKDFIGYAEGTTDTEIEYRINQCISSGCPDSVYSIVNNSQDNNSSQLAVENQPPNDTVDSRQSQDDTDKQQKKIIKLPIVGEVDAVQYSLPLLTVLIGALDGFNPCAMWTLLFLISLLLGFKDRKKMWILGGAFILASGFVYFLFMAAWLKLILFLGFVVWVRTLIGAIALGGGAYSIKKGLANKDGGCEVTGNEKRQATFARIRKVVQNNNLWLALAGIVLLAFAVNLVELICSAGLPAVYTQVLALNDLATWQYYGYIMLYIFFFMLDDMIIFAVAMTTLKLTGLSTKYSRYSNLIGGILMVIIGLLLIFKPEWLMFG